MPDELCRHCGEKLYDLHKCVECNRVVSMICKNCGNKTIEQFHTDCLYFEPNLSTQTINHAQNFSLASLA